MKEYLDLGLIADYYRWRGDVDENYSDTVPYSIRDETSMTPKKVLSGELMPTTIQGQRALALVYAVNKCEAPALTKLMFSQQDELCFQIYAACSLKIDGMISLAMQRPDLTLQELAILAYLADDNLFGEEIKRNDALEYLQCRVELLLQDNPKIVFNPYFNYICSFGYKTSTLATNWQNAKSSSLGERSKCVKYFSSMHVNFKELLKAVCQCDDLYSYRQQFSQLLDELLEQANIWTEDEFKAVTKLVKSHDSDKCISRYQNYVRLHEAVPFKPSLFQLCQYDHHFKQKFAVLSFSERVAALKRTFISTKMVQQELIPEYFEEIKQVFKSYNSNLQNAWDSCWQSLDCYYDYHYPCNFLSAKFKEGHDLSNYLELLSKHTLYAFLQDVKNEIVANAVYTFCSDNSMLQSLEKYSEFFDKHKQVQIKIAVKKYDRGIHPSLPPKTNLTDIPMVLQPFVSKTKYSFKELTLEEQLLLGNCVPANCKLKKAEIIKCIKLVMSCESYQYEILHSLLQVGAKWFNQVRHFYQDLQFYEKDFSADLVCHDDFVYLEAGQTLAEAAYFKGRHFKRTRNLNQRFSSKMLDFFQWCGTDRVDATSLRGNTVDDFAKFYAKSVLGHDIDNWEIEDGSPLLDVTCLSMVNWDRRPDLLCKAGTHFLVNTLVPTELLDIPTCEEECNNVLSNLLRHPIEWYQSFKDWKQILVYNFDWDYDFCMIAKDVIDSNASSQQELFLKVFKRFGYTEAQQLVINTTLLVNSSAA